MLKFVQERKNFNINFFPHYFLLLKNVSKVQNDWWNAFEHLRKDESVIFYFPEQFNQQKSWSFVNILNVISKWKHSVKYKYLGL